MDRKQEELQFLGFSGVCKESFKIIFTWPKFFAKITISLIFPLSFIFLANIGLSFLLTSKINTLDQTSQGAASYNSFSSGEWAAYWLIKAAYFTFLLIFSLLSTSTVVYAVASINTAEYITFTRVLSVVPKVWKRLIHTFLSGFGVCFLYSLLALIVLIILEILFGVDSAGKAKTVAITFLSLLYLTGLVYLTVIYQLANVVSVLEDQRGYKAMVRSKGLIKGKMFVSVAVFCMLNLFSLLIGVMFELLVASSEYSGVLGRIGFGVLSLGVLSFVFLFKLVVQTVIYFVCKSYHHEREYVPLTAKDVQLEEV